MKRVFALAILAIMVFAFAGCDVLNSNNLKTVRGRDNMSAFEFAVDAYTTVDISLQAELYYTAGTSDKIILEIQENLVEHLDISVTNGVLTIQANANLITDANRMPKLFITTPTLEQVTVHGSVALKESDPIITDSLTLNIHGSCKGELTVEAEQLKIESSGDCSLTLFGNAQSAIINIQGAGTVNALRLQTQTANINIDGAGSVDIACSDELTIAMRGYGTVNYRGQPHVSQSGDGSVTRVD